MHNISTIISLQPTHVTADPYSGWNFGDDGEGGSVHLLIGRYLAYRRGLGEISGTSARAIRSHLIDFADNTKAKPSRVNRRHVEAWMSRPDLAPSYRRSRFSSLRGFCRWCVERGHMRKDPTLGLKAPKVPDALPRSLQLHDAVAVIGASIDTRTRLCGLLMVQEGLRRGEVAAAQYGDLDLRRGVLAVRGKGGGGARTGEVPLSAETLVALDRYLLDHQVTSGRLIRSHRGKGHEGVSPATVGELLLQAFRDSGVKAYNGDGRSAHALRHTCAADMIDQGADVLEVKQALRHKAISSTMVYLRGVTPDLRTAMDGRAYTESQHPTLPFG